MSKVKLLVYRCCYITLALMIIGVAIDVSIKAGLGVSSWTVFHLGIAKHTGFTQGQISQFVGLVIVGLSYFLGIKPALGTVMNMVLIGWFYDLSVVLSLIPQATNLYAAAFYIAVSVFLTGFGGAMYMSAGLGAGPRDSLMLALTKHLNWPVGRIKTTMEVTVLVLGWILGGPVGIGTVAFSISVGPTMQRSFEFFRSLTAINSLAGAVMVIPVAKRAVKAKIARGCLSTETPS
ncbi:MAG: hypothetical protein FD169_1704 [Bacillota bacterium]|nr:MAG: hypothetical protein FD169_1704 [Bacillota bacterium]MBS3950620.1 membrane protein [Peptococcaceae bacterium]